MTNKFKNGTNQINQAGVDGGTNTRNKDIAKTIYKSKSSLFIF